jgi:hypothetical protein
VSALDDFFPTCGFRRRRNRRTEVPAVHVLTVPKRILPRKSPSLCIRNCSVDRLIPRRAAFVGTRHNPTRILKGGQNVLADSLLERFLLAEGWFPDHHELFRLGQPNPKEKIRPSAQSTVAKAADSRLVVCVRRLVVC